ncbi:MAG: hypothetical protein Q9224_004797, partial [Gallowayella concinna]
MATTQIPKPGHAYENGHVEKFRFEKEGKTQEQSHQKGWAKFDLNGLWCFQNLQSPAARAAALGLLFPGAGLIAVGNIPATIAFVLTLIGIPITLFVWFAMGGVLFPLLLWFGTALLAAALAGNSLVEQSGLFWGASCIAMVSWAVWKSSKINAQGKITQQRRNQWLPAKVKEQADQAIAAPTPGSRELDLHTLRFVQHMVER